MKLLNMTFIAMMVVVTTQVAILPCSAGVAISGSFYSHDYVLAQGEQISSKDIYVVVYNKDDKRVRVDMEYEAPEFLEVHLSSESSLIEPGEYKRIYITLKAHEEAVPGDYTVKVIAIVNEVKGDQPVKVLTSAAQEAAVRIGGEYGIVTVAAIDPVGNIATTALIRFFRENYEMGNDYGELEMRVVPGRYSAKAYLLGEEVASKEFDVAPFDKKRVELPVRSVYFENFGVQPAKDDAGNIGYVYTVAVIKNLYKELPNVIISLQVSGAAEEYFTIYSSPSLPLNRTEIKYNYFPAAGWKHGDYKFSAKVTSDGTIYAESPEKIIKYRSPTTQNFKMLFFVAVLVIASFIIVIVVRKKRMK